MDQAKWFVTMRRDGTAIVAMNFRVRRKLKLVIVKGGESVSHNVGSGLVVPLTFGSGAYEFRMCEQRQGQEYIVLDRIYQHFEDSNPPAYQYSASSYVTFTASSPFYAKARELGTVERIEKYIAENFHYDMAKAKRKSNTSMTLPDTMQCYRTKQGICYDLAALMTAMCRINHIPTALVCGLANGQPHAWVETGDETYDITREVTGDKTAYTYQPERRY